MNFMEAESAALEDSQSEIARKAWGDNAYVSLVPEQIGETERGETTLVYGFHAVHVRVDGHEQIETMTFVNGIWAYFPEEAEFDDWYVIDR